MLKNYFTVAFRNFWRNKVFSLINISGLAIGISTALIIYLVVQFEFSFEKFRKDGDKIYRVVSELTFPGDVKFKNSGVPMPMPEAVRKEMTGIDQATHFITTNEVNVAVPFAGSQPPALFKKQTAIVYADEFYFSLFEYDWLAGSKQAALIDPFQVVLTEKRAAAYFGNTPAKDLIGKEIIYDDSIITRIAGIVKEPAEKATDFRFKEFISLATVLKTGLAERFGGDEWGSINSVSQLFVKLKKGTTPDQVQSQFAVLRNKYNPPKDGETDDTQNYLQPLRAMHFNADYDSFQQRQAHKPTLYGLLAVAAFLLLLGCINFINLTTAQASRRAKEIGIRKTLGSGKKELVIQFLSETFLLTLTATVISILITPWLLHIFKDFIPADIRFSSVNQVHVWVFLLLLILVMTLLSGFYPAWVLTKFQPVSVLKNQANVGSKQNRKAWLRKTLTVTQFVIAQFLVIATLVVGKQINYSLHKDLGYKKDAIVSFRTPWNFSAQEDNRKFVLLEKIKMIPGIEKACLSSATPAHQGSSSTTLTVDNGREEKELTVEIVNADPGYFDIYQMKRLGGKIPVQSDTVSEYLVNETYARALGFAKPVEAIGKYIIRKTTRLPIVGVLADFHTKSTHEPIKPLAYTNARKDSYVFNLALQSADQSQVSWSSTLAKVEKEYKSLFPEEEFNDSFFDETIAGFYKNEQQISRLLTWASGLCIFISCLGLLGLVMYMTNTRTKEIGVRKVLGATVLQIVSLLSKDLLSLVLVAFIIAAPLAWLAMNRWLQDYVYRTKLGWEVFAFCGSSMLFVAIIILSFRTIKAAMNNPVKNLRTE